jgi:hypothetical protein
MTDPIQRLREAHEAATPGPWSARAVEETKDAWWSVDAPGDPPGLALTSVADAHAIVLAHNALPALLDIAEAARRYLAHVAEAAAWNTPGVGCDVQCDEAAALRAALDRLEEVGS